MEHCEEIKSEYNHEDEETIYDHREYIIEDKDIKYILRLEINEKNIYIIVSLKDNKEYNYKTKMNLSSIVKKLELNPVTYSIE